MSWLQSSASDCRRLWRLSWTERWLLAESFAVLAGASLGLRLLGFRRCYFLLNLLAPGADELELPVAAEHLAVLAHEKVRGRSLLVAPGERALARIHR